MRLRGISLMQNWEIPPFQTTYAVANRRTAAFCRLLCHTFSEGIPSLRFEGEL